MKKYFIISIAIFSSLSALWFSACETTEQIDDFPIIKPQIVLNSMLSPDSTWVFQVSRSLSVLDNANTNLLTQAKVTVYDDNNKELFSTQSVNNRGYFEYQGQLPEVGKNYRVEVSSDKFNTVKASCQIPVKVEVTKIKTIIKDSSTWWDYFNKRSYGNISGEVSVSFKDPANEENYYILEFATVDTFIWDDGMGNKIMNIEKQYLVQGNEEHPVVDAINDKGFIFSDQFIDGQVFTFTMPLEDYNFYEGKNYLVQLKSLSREAYLYYRSLAVYVTRQDNPFAEPVQVYSNIENGFGVFAAYNMSVTGFQF